MPIITENIKLMSSQRLTDRDDGGGRITGNEIVDGNVNNLFPDISRLDRVYGRVSLRKAFVAVQTNDTETYSGSHVILSKPAEDPKVSVCMFSTGDPNDQRTAARNRVESYVTIGPRFSGWLWGDQPAGARSILLFCIKNTPVPDVGSVLCLFNNKGTGSEQSQYVRITKVEKTTGEFSTSDYEQMAQSFNRDIMQIEIGDPLRYTFTGIEISKNDALATSVYTTVVSDASKYYGVMKPTTPINSGDIGINVDSIFTHLVPSAQGESPVVDLSVGEAGPVIGSGSPYSVTATSFAVSSGAQVYFGRGIKRGSLTITTSNSKTYTDDSNGYLYEGLSQVGTVDYSTGTILFSNIASGYTANLTLTAIIGAEDIRVPETSCQIVTLSNRGYNYVTIINPLPMPGTVWVDYMAQGKWYRLRDDGDGTLVPDISGTGTGTINYATGSLILTCGALPDVDTKIIYTWSNPTETKDLSGEVTIQTPEINHLLANAPVQPLTLSITWPVGADATGTATDDGSGVITGDATGTINYSTGEIMFKPTLLPLSGSEYTIDYEKYAKVEGTVPGVNINHEAGIWSFTLSDGPIKTKSVNIDVQVAYGNYQHIYRMKDDGAGNLSSDPWEFLLTATDPSLPETTFTSSERPTTIKMNGITGTIDYVTKFVTINLVNVAGTKSQAGFSIDWFDFDGPDPFKPRFYPKWVPPVESAITTTGMTVGSAIYVYSLSATAAETANETLLARPFDLALMRNKAGYTIVPGSVNFTWSGVRYIDRLGKLYRNPSPTTGLGAEAGTINYSTGLATLSVYDGGSNTISLHSMTGRFGRQLLTTAVFRTPGAPLRPGSLTVIGVASDGTQITGTSNFDGTMGGEQCTGEIDYDKGIVILQFGSMVDDGPEYYDEPWYDAGNVTNGQIFRPKPVFTDTLTYACVVYSYIPLNADLIGLDPVRLPSDGRVPIVKTGDVVVIHNTQNDELPQPLSSGQVITLSRGNVSSVELYDSTSPTPLRVPSTHYVWDKEAQTLTMSVALNLTGFTEPLICMHKVEDMALVSGVQINGQLTVATGLQNAYPVLGTYVSTALLFGDLQARAYGLFDQTTWTSVWSDSVIGSATAANYNEINYPVLVTNAGAVRERWALVFTSSTTFNIIGEAYGVVGTGTTNNDVNPINPATGQPFFFMDYRGFGAGWATSNVIRFNTEGAMGDLWVARTTLQGPVTEPSDMFTIQIRGDAE